MASCAAPPDLTLRLVLKDFAPAHAPAKPLFSGRAEESDDSRELLAEQQYLNWDRSVSKISTKGHFNGESPDFARQRALGAIVFVLAAGLLRCEELGYLVRR